MILRNKNFVKLTHIPTGISVECNYYRSQHTNRAACLNRLRSRLYALENNIKPNKEVIRTYNLD